MNIPASARQAVAEVQRRFLPLDLKASWVSPDNIHLTLKFLGDIDPKQVPEISGALTEALREFPVFTLSLGSAGVFPRSGPPRVLWVGLEDPERHLSTLKDVVEAVLEPLGFPREPRPFSPHLTLARIKSPKGAQVLRRQVEASGPVPPVPFPVERVTFYQSQLTPKGSIYTALEQFPLTA